jgi:hypothetical protein
MPLTLQDFRPASMTAVLFVQNPLLRAASLLRDLPQQFVDRFESEPFVLPSSATAPPEIPRLILQSAATGWACHFTGERVAIIQNEVSTNAPAIATVEYYRQATDLLLNLWGEVPRVRPNRVAAIAIRYARHAQPGIFLSRHFCRQDRIEGPDAPLNRPENFELHAHKTYRMADQFNVNSWVRVKTGTTVEPDATPIVILEQDTNTKPENAAARELTREEVQGFFDGIAAEQDHVLNLYFPQ